jgi:26S proteasome regulatory subunit N1
LLRFADYISDEDDLRELLRVTYEIYSAQKQWPDALRVALRTYMQIADVADKDGESSDDEDGETNLGLARVKAALDGCEDPLVRKQMAYIIGSHRAFAFTYESDPSLDREDDDDINEIVSGTSLWESFQGLARDLSVEEAKTPEDIYKSHLSDSASSSSHKVDGAHIESARQNLATTFVNAFVNAGFQKDALMTPEGSKWLYKNKEHGMMSAAASLGMVLLWNVDEGLSQIDKFLYSGESNIKAGALLALGICNCGVRDECDAGMGLLPEHLEEKNDKVVRMAAAVGLGLAYAGNPREEVAEALTPIVADTSDTASMEVVSLAALALGISFVGTADDDVSTCLLQRLMEAKDAELDQSCARLLCVALGLLYLGKQDGADAMMEAIKAVRPGKHNLVQFLEVVMETCAHAGTGNVLVIQKLLHICAEHLLPEGESSKADGAGGGGGG